MTAMMPQRIIWRPQGGFVLLMALVFLIMLTMLGLSAIQGSTLQESMAGNIRDRNIALQAAELALRDAERDLAALKADGLTFCAAGSSGCRPSGARATAAADRQAFWAWGPALRTTWTSACTLGQCDSTAFVGSYPVWSDSAADWSPQTGGTSGGYPTVEYGKYTGATAIPGVAAQPRYIMEIFPASAKDWQGVLGSQRVMFRITVRAVGQNPNTVVILQSVSSPS